ncbi:MAG: PilZ domain-containing protein [Oscillospiraceae bacterium]
MIFGNSNKVIKIDIVDSNNTVVVSSEKGFNFPKNLDSDEDSIVMIKGKKLREFPNDERVSLITTLKSGERVKYVGVITMSTDFQLNVKILKSGDTEVLQERRRYFKIKVRENGRVLFFMRDEETIRFDEPQPMAILDINIGGVFMTADYEFAQEDIVCVEIDLFVDYKLNALAKILRVQRDPDGNITGYGCEFQGLTAAQEDYIGKFIYKAQSEQRQKEMAKLNGD